MTGPDTEGIGEALAGAGVAFAAAGAAATEALRGLRPGSPSAVVLVAGPRAQPACEAAAALLRPTSPVPVEHADGSVLAAYVGKGSLVVVCGLGGLEAHQAARVANEAAGRGADVLVVGGRGHLAPHGATPPAPAGGDPLGPDGERAPVALAPLVEVLPALVAVAGWAGLLPDAGQAGAGAAAALSAAAGSLGTPGGAHHDRLARRIGRTIPLFEGASGIGAVVARSWRRSWNLLAKAPAFATTQPRAAFEDVAGFGQHGDVTRQILTLVSLRTAADAPGDVTRSRLFAELADEALAGTLEITAPGDEPAAALVRLEWLGLATAYARACQEGLDPGPLPAPDEVEARLAAAGGPSHLGDPFP